MSRGGGQELSVSVDRCNKLEKENLELRSRADKLVSAAVLCIDLAIAVIAFV